MRHLKEPNRGEPIKADDIREMILAIRENNVTAGTGLAETQTPHGKIISLKQLNRQNRSDAISIPQPFHMEIDGSIATFTHCRFMKQAITLVFADPAPLTLTGTSGYIYVKYDTEAGTMTVNYTTTAGTSYDAEAPTDEFTKGLIYEVSRADTNSAWSVDVDSRMTGLNLALYV